MGDINFTIEEKAFVDQVIQKGMLQPSGNASPYWWVMRLALAKSLSIAADPTDRAYDRVPAVKGGSELHLQQVVGTAGKDAGRDAGPDADLSDSFRFLLSTRHQADYFSDNTAFIEILARHLHRGLSELKASWRDGSDFHDLLLDDLYYDARPDAAPAATGGVGGAGPVTLARLMAGLKQIEVRTDAGENATEGPRLTRFELPLASIEDYERLRRGLEDLAFTMGLGESALALTRSAGERRVLLDIPRPVATWRAVHWSQLSGSLAARTETLPICIGTDVLGSPFVFDLAEAPHLFVGGTTGSGKSVCLNAILLSALGAAKPPQLVLIDPKAVDFTGYEKCHQLLKGSITTDAATAVTILDELVEEMETRAQHFRALGVRVLAEAQAKGSELKRIVVVIDEVADLFIAAQGDRTARSSGSLRNPGRAAYTSCWRRSGRTRSPSRDC